MAISTVGTKLFMSKITHKDVDTPPLESELVALGCDATSNSITGGQTTEIDVTALCDTTRKFIAGLRDAGSASLTLFFSNKADSAYKTAKDGYNKADLRYFKLVLSDGSTFEYIGFINSWSLTLDVDAAVQSEMGVKLSGAVKESVTIL